MSLLSVVKEVCAAIGVNPPTSMFASSVQPRTQLELLSLANEMAQRITADTRNWTKLKKIHTFAGDYVIPGGTGDLVTAYNMPPDYLRLPIDGNVWRAIAPQVPMQFISSSERWLQRRLANTNDTHGEWIIFGGQMHIYPPLAPKVTTPGAEVNAETATFFYLHKNSIQLSTAGFGSEFQNDTDVFWLGERLLKLGMIWQWKANKGSPYAEDMGTYSDALTNAMGSDQPSPIITDAQPRSLEGWHATVW